MTPTATAPAARARAAAAPAPARAATPARPAAPAAPAPPAAAPATTQDPRAEATCLPVLDVFLRGEPQIAGDPRFTRHLRADAGVNWNGVLAETGWSQGQRVLISLAAALCGHGQVPPGSLSAHLTGRQTSLVLAMCQAARR